MHQIMLISLISTPFGHFQFLGSAGQNPNLILTLCLILVSETGDFLTEWQDLLQERQTHRPTHW